MEKEIRELTSRIEDLLQMIGDDQQSGDQAGIDHHPSQQTGDIWDDECSVSESVAEPRYLCGGGKRYNVSQYVGDSGSNAEEPYQGHFMWDGTSSLTSIGKKIVRSCSGLSPVGDAVEAADENCSEGQCIEMKENSMGEKCDPRHESDGVLALPWSGNEDATQEVQCIQTKESSIGEKCDPRHESDGVRALTSSGNEDAAQEASTNGEVTHMQNGFTYNTLEQRLHHVQKTIDRLVSPYHDPPSPQLSHSMTC